jgi:phospholipid/cholesterol/gamma-HCH transport system permease protein
MPIFDTENLSGKLDTIAKKMVLSTQEYSIFCARAVTSVFSAPRYWADIFLQADMIGVGSMPIVLMTGFFIGGSLALQSAATLSQFGARSVTGELVSLAMIRELGPVLTALMVSGRCASGMASELGSMQVTEQVDAMRALGTDPMRKLVAPRVIGTTLMLFFLTVIADAVGILGGAMVSVSMLHLNAAQFFHTAYQALGTPDIVQGITKPFPFGFIIATVGCYFGMFTKGGTQGVGRATTQAVVASSVLIIAADFVLNRIMLAIFGG